MQVLGDTNRTGKLGQAISTDRVVQTLQTRGLVKKIESDGRAHIVCPFESEHTTDSGLPDTTYFPAHTHGYAQGHFHCLHAHCSNRTDQEFEQALGLLADEFENLDALDSQTAADLKQIPLPKALTRANTKRHSPTEFGNAMRLLDRYGEDLMYVPELESWFRWTSTFWYQTPCTTVLYLAKQTVLSLHNEARAIQDEGARDALIKFAAQSQKLSMVRNMLSLAASEPKVNVAARSLDKQKDLLGVANGVIDLRTGKLMPAQRQDRITLTSTIAHDARAKAPLFEQTVSDVFYNDKDMVCFFQRVIGYTFTGCPDEDILVILHGDGSNGKSTVLGAIRKVMDQHARVAQAETFMTDKVVSSAGSAREDILRLRGARLVYTTEPDENCVLHEGLIKSMTGGEPIPARGVYGRATIEVPVTWTVFMATNHKPIIKGNDHGIWRRLMLIPFTRNLDADPNITKDIHRKHGLAKEAAGILNWCVQGALDYQKQGLNPPPKVQQARQEYRQSMDLLHEWLNECCEIGPAYTVSNADLWRSWQNWAMNRGEINHIKSQTALSRRLGSRFTSIKDTEGVRGRGFKGLRLGKVEGI